jgi:Tfp pilus assembly protein PilF
MIRRRTRRVLAIGLALAGFLGASLAEAQTFGRVKFIVKTPDGQPAQGVKITVTCRDRGSYQQELKTNKKGEAVLSVVDATKRYQLRLEHEGYPPIEDEVKPELRGTSTHEVVLVPTAAPPPPAAGGTLTAAQEAFNAGVKAAQADDLETAKAKFQEAIERDAKLAPPHVALAGVYLEEKDPEAAIRHANRVLELQPRNTRAYRILYEAHTDLGNQKEAKEALAALSEFDEGGDTAAVVFNEGVAAYRVGDNETAKTNFERALELQNDLTAAMSALALLYLKEGRFAESAEMAERFLALQPSDAKVLQMRWEAYRGLGDPAKEKEAFDALAAVDTGVLATEFFNTGAQLFEGGNVQGARENFERVLALDPEHPRAHYQLALCLVNSGEKAAAREHFQKFLELAPDDPEAAAAKEMLGYLK